MRAPAHPSESSRAASAKDLLGTVPRQGADDLAFLARVICGTPMAVTSLIDDEHQWYEGRSGVDGTHVENEVTFCQFTILQDDILEVTDARLDDRFKHNPYVEAGDVRYYAGLRIRDVNDLPVGTICVYGPTPHRLDETQRLALAALGRQFETLLQVARGLKDANKILDAFGSERQRGLNAASDVLLNPMTAMALQLSYLEQRAPEEKETLSKIRDNLERTIAAVRTTLRDALPTRS